LGGHFGKGGWGAEWVGGVSSGWVVLATGEFKLRCSVFTYRKWPSGSSSS
jgi:hypothetical protein